MTQQSDGPERPELTVEERLVRDHIKRARKLRWIGLLDERTARPESLPTGAALFKANFKRTCLSG